MPKSGHNALAVTTVKSFKKLNCFIIPKLKSVNKRFYTYFVN